MQDAWALARQIEQEIALPQERRAQIQALEQTLAQVPGAIFGDSDVCPLVHRFADGIYVREIFIPAGMLLTGKIHKHAHPNFLMQGEVLVVTEQGGQEHLRAPLAMISPPGTKRAVYALTDVVWITVHASEETDLTKLEAQIIAPDYEAYAAFRAEKERGPCPLLPSP